MSFTLDDITIRNPEQGDSFILDPNSMIHDFNDNMPEVVNVNNFIKTVKLTFKIDNAQRLSLIDKIVSGIFNKKVKIIYNESVHYIYILSNLINIIALHDECLYLFEIEFMLDYTKKIVIIDSVSYNDVNTTIEIT
jgi:hypothetical protein